MYILSQAVTFNLDVPNIVCHNSCVSDSFHTNTHRIRLHGSMVSVVQFKSKEVKATHGMEVQMIQTVLNLIVDVHLHL
jgi:hypothetical protein